MDKQRAWFKWLKARRKKCLRILAVILSICVLFTTYPDILVALSVSASEEQEAQKVRYISGFTALPDEIREQTVPVGTPLAKLQLPDTLEAVIIIEGTEKPSGAGQENTSESTPESMSEDGEKAENTPESTPESTSEDGEEPESETKPESTPEGENKPEGTPDGGEKPEEAGQPAGADGLTEADTGNAADTENAPSEGQEEQEKPEERQEIHTVTLPEYRAENVIPIQTVQTVEAVQTQDTEYEEAPETETVTISGVTWRSEPEYDENAGRTYVFTAVLPDGYVLAEGVSLPEIKVNAGCDHGVAAAGEVCPVCELQAEIDALPDAEEIKKAIEGMYTGTPEMSGEEIDALYERLSALLDTYDGFPKEWQEMVDAERLFALLALFSGEDMLTAADGNDVLVFSPMVRSNIAVVSSESDHGWMCAFRNVFEGEGYNMRTKYGATEQHLTKSDMDGIGLLILWLPMLAPNDNDISLMRDFLAGGGRIVMIGENGRQFATENRILSETAYKLGAEFTITDRTIRGGQVLQGSANMPPNALTKDVKQFLTCTVAAPIEYRGSAEPVLLSEGEAWMVDHAAGKGRITSVSDINCFAATRWIPDPAHYGEYVQGVPAVADTAKWIFRWLLDARENQETVLRGGDPNLGFGGSPIVSVDAKKEHVAALGDYSFTVTYSVSSRSSANAIDADTIGTDDVTVTDESGTSLLISGAQIVSGQNTKNLVVRYTVEAQQSGSFIPGKYTIGINNAAVADTAGKEIGSNPQAAVFQVITSPLQITGRKMLTSEL